MLKFMVILFIMISKIFTSNTWRCSNIVRYNLVFDDKMPSAYTDIDFYVQDNLKKHAYSIEHIFPRSFMEKKAYNDMHNTIRTLNDLNINRSNYKYMDTITADKNWIKLDFDNYVNHKLRLFVPNSLSRGFISRAILYMSSEYNYNPSVIIDKDVLIDWFYKHPPSDCEKYHNHVVKKIQNKNNVFISSYNKKVVERYLKKL